MRRHGTFGIALLLIAASLVLAAEEVNPLLIKVKPAKLTPLKKEALAWVDAAMPELAKLSDDIWRNAEVALDEHRSADALASYLESAGFKVEKGVGGLPTAFVGTFGSGQPVIGFLAEYDALPGLSQEAATTKKPLREGAPGHGCGHNIFGVGTVASAVAVKDVMAQHRIPGTLKVFGCPAEETVEGKVFMARDGVFDGLSLCIQWHPSDDNSVSLGSSNALNQFEAEFFGQTAHAAGDPWHGRSALDGIELADIGLNFLREHLRPTARLHYVILEGGGAPNVVPDHARAWYYVRDLDRESVEKTMSGCSSHRGRRQVSGTTWSFQERSPRAWPTGRRRGRLPASFSSGPGF
jgi:aminobenzoyl-glutamate utilization protein B